MACEPHNDSEMRQWRDFTVGIRPLIFMVKTSGLVTRVLYYEDAPPIRVRFKCDPIQPATDPPPGW